MSQPGWHPDPNDPRAEVYWTGYQWGGRRARNPNPGSPQYPGHAPPFGQPAPMYAYGPMPPLARKKPMGVGTALAITAACILIAVIAFVGWAVATGPRNEFEACVQRNTGGILDKSESEAEEWCRMMENLQK
jgi:hypothetical protein